MQWDETPNQPGHFPHYGTKLILVCHFISSCVATSSATKDGVVTGTLSMKNGFRTKRHNSENV